MKLKDRIEEIKDWISYHSDLENWELAVLFIIKALTENSQYEIIIPPGRGKDTTKELPIRFESADDAIMVDSFFNGKGSFGSLLLFSEIKEVTFEHNFEDADYMLYFKKN